MKPAIKPNCSVPALNYLLLLLTIAGCSAPAGFAPTGSGLQNVNSASVSSDDATDVERLGRLWEKRTRDTLLTEYPIGPGDVLEISVPSIDELKDRTVRVTTEGAISLPFVGRIKAAGLTEEQLAEQLRSSLKEYLRSPRVFIFVKEYNSRQVAVLGAVPRPGLYSLTNGSENVLEMISRAGGMLPDAEPVIQLVPTEPLKSGGTMLAVSEAPPGILYKDSPAPLLKKTEPILIDVNQLSYGGQQAYLSLPVRPGDTIMVPGGGQILVEGWVDKPGGYKMTPGLTVVAAVDAAGGALFAADTSSVKVIRPRKNGNKLTLTADLDKIKQGETPDLRLQGGDIVQVTSSTVKLVPYGIYDLFRNVIRVGVESNVFK